MTDKPGAPAHPMSAPTDEEVVPFTFAYRNYRGEVSERRVMPIHVRFGSTEWHPEPQWLMNANDLDKGETREFAMKDIGAAKLSGGAGDDLVLGKPTDVHGVADSLWTITRWLEHDATSKSEIVSALDEEIQMLRNNPATPPAEPAVVPLGKPAGTDTIADSLWMIARWIETDAATKAEILYSLEEDIMALRALTKPAPVADDLVERLMHKGEKLTIRQQAALEALTERDASSSDLLLKEVTGNTTYSLHQRGFITLRHYANGWFWSITEAGRVALTTQGGGDGR